MKRPTMKKWSFIGLFLMIASVVTAAITSFRKSVDENNFAAGSLIQSTGINGGLTVAAGANSKYSYTATGMPCDEDDDLSATSNTNPVCTLTQEIGNDTGNGTSVAGN